jgi:hypothetical protein
VRGLSTALALRSRNKRSLRESGCGIGEKFPSGTQGKLSAPLRAGSE